ncbi:hypothetical protein N7454_000589 [Penicillium verhagenii]|nr:hypothetical protein N7454_000589 [Penicillium verhagenii]
MISLDNQYLTKVYDQTSGNSFQSTSASRKHKAETAETVTSQSTNSDLGSRKRPRIEKGTESRPSTDTGASEPRNHKRESELFSHEWTESNDSGSTETEDMSAEVRRRLRIREEQRLRQESYKPDKRKRDSANVEPESWHHPRKRLKGSDTPAGDSASGSGSGAGRAKKMKNGE